MALALVETEEERQSRHEAYLKRVEEAEQLEEKLRVISESVPTKICNTAGSTAGAGSGDFHTYRSQKRRDQIRQTKLEGDLKREREQAAFDRHKEEVSAASTAKTDKRRAKRNKLKEKRKAKREEKKKLNSNSNNGDAQKGNGPKRRRLEEEKHQNEEPPLEVADLD
jgi:hypothetical protein